MAPSDDPLKRDFRLFLMLVWEHLGLPAPTPVQLEIASYLQHGPKRLWVAAFRGLGKSWITVAFVLWLLYCDPQLNILVVSASKQHADNFSTFCKRLLNEMEILAHLRPRADQRDSNIAFDVGPAEADLAPSVRSAGITGQMTGSRADVIIADDIEVPKNSATQTQRDKLLKGLGEFNDILKPQDNARIVFLGTPQSDQTVYNSLPREVYEVRFWPARYPKSLLGYKERLAPTILKAMSKDPTLSHKYGKHGAPTDKRFTHVDLVEREIAKGKSEFALQFMLDTTLSDADRYPLRVSDLVVFDCDPTKAPVNLAWGSDPSLRLDDVPNVAFNGDYLHRPFMVSTEAQEWSPYHGIVMTIDPAGRGGDEVGYAVVAFHYGRLYLLDAGGLKGGYADENLIALAQTAKRWKVSRVVLEPNFGDGMFSKLLTPHLTRIYPCSVEDTERNNTQKEVRIIDTLEPVLNQHRLIVNKALFQQDFDSVDNYASELQHRYRLFYQLTRITKEKGSLAKDDRLDAVALAIHYWTEQMDRDVEKSSKLLKDKLLNEELRKFAKHVLGHVPRPQTYAGRRERTMRRG